jgi:DNA-binding CsgD family transcriptional regulator
VRADLSTIPLYCAHVHADHARIAHLVQGADSARRSLDVATGIYRSLEAHSYLNRVLAVGRRPTVAPPAARIQLSDRERDVLALVVSGMSYAQIARDLFITQSTVSYHLGNIYAKADVKSRHQLTQLARSDPATLGLPDLEASRV